MEDELPLVSKFSAASGYWHRIKTEGGTEWTESKMGIWISNFEKALFIGAGLRMFD